MSSFANVSQVGVIAVAEVLAGGVAGMLIDAVFPDAAPDAPILVQAAEILGETAVVGIMLALSGKQLLNTINPTNATGGFTFFLGLTSGIANYRVKLETLMTKLRIRGAEAFNNAVGSVQPMVVEKVTQKAPQAE